MLTAFFPDRCEKLRMLCIDSKREQIVPFRQKDSTWTGAKSTLLGQMQKAFGSKQEQIVVLFF
jgi:hypothetical protein